MRGQSEVSATAMNVSQREPTRSFFHSSFRGHLGMKNLQDQVKLIQANSSPNSTR
jgi:hypothetical protein